MLAGSLGHKGVDGATSLLDRASIYPSLMIESSNCSDPTHWSPDSRVCSLDTVMEKTARPFQMPQHHGPVRYQGGLDISLVFILGSKFTTCGSSLTRYLVVSQMSDVLCVLIVPHFQ